MMDRYLLRYFLAVVDQGNFSRAAAHCAVSQPTLSAGIAKLERELETMLFFRSNQRVELTDAGRRLLNHARRIEAEFNQASEAVRGTVAARPLRLGVLGSFPSGLVARALADRPEGAAIELSFASERELIGHLARGRIDVALTLIERGSDRFLEQPLFREGYSVVVAAGHRLAGQGEVAAEELAGEAMIVRRHCEVLAQTSRFFTDRGIRPHFALRSQNDERVLAMVAAGLGVTVMPDSFVAPDIARLKLSGFDLTRTLGLAFAHEAEGMAADPPPLLAHLIGSVGAGR